MRAMILAAGRGKRLSPLTDSCPKPLLPVQGKPLLAYHLSALQQAGVQDVVINVSYLGHQIQAYVGDGTAFGVRVRYSVEPNALETGGGLFQALPLLGPQPFIVLNADVWTDYPLETLQLAGNDLAHLVCVPNPAHNLQGDFDIDQGRVRRHAGAHQATLAGISVLSPRLFEGCVPGKYSVVPLYLEAITRDRLSGELYQGRWVDIGSPETYAMVNAS